MRKIIFILALVGCSMAASSQTLNPFPTTDSLRKFINKWIRNSAVDAFTNLRLNTALNGMTRFIDSADSGLSPSDTATMLAGYTRLSRFLDSCAALRAAISGAAGSPGGSNGQVQYNNAGAFAGDAGLTYNATTNKLTTDSTTAIKANTDTIRSGVLLSPNIKNWWFFGTSITNRFGIALASNSWINLVCSYFGKIVNNKGVNGATVIKASPVDPFGGQNMIDYMQSNLLTKTGADERIFFAFGENDFNVNSVNYTATAYRLAMDSVVKFAITKGYSLSDMVIVGPGYIDTVSNSAATRLRQIDFNDTLRAYAASKGITFVDLWAKAFSQNWFYLYRPQAPLTHPGVEGHSLYANIVIETLGDQIVAGGQRVAISDTTELQHVRIKSADTATATTRPLGASPGGRLLKYPLNAFIPNDPVDFTNGRIKLNGDIYANTMTPLFLRGGTGNRQTGYTGTAWEIFTASNIPTMYAFDQSAVAWREGQFHAANFLWQVQTNSNFQLTMSTGGVLESTQNGNSTAYFSVGNSNTGTGASSELRIGPNSTAGNGGRLAYFSTGYTLNGIYAPSTVLLEAGPTTATGLSLSASNASGVIKAYTGGTLATNERMRIAADGQVSLFKTLTGSNSMRFMVKGIDSVLYQIDASALPAPSLTTNYIGVGSSNLLSGSAAYTYTGTSVLQENSGAIGAITSTTTLGSTSGGVLNLYAKDLPTGANQVLGTINFGSRNGTTADNVGIRLRAQTNGAWVDGSAEQAYLTVETNATGTLNEIMRWTANGRVGIGAISNPNSRVQLAAGSTALAPISLTTGSVLTSPVAGTLEWDASANGGAPTFTPVSTRYKTVLSNTGAAIDGQIPIGSTSSGVYTSATITGGSTISVTNGAGSITLAVPTTYLTGATYSPATTLVTNVSSATVNAASYTRTGSIITFSIDITVDPVAIGAAEVGIAFPSGINNIVAASDVRGVGNTIDVELENGMVRGDISNNRMSFRFVANNTGARTYSLTGQYTYTAP